MRLWLVAIQMLFLAVTCLAEDPLAAYVKPDLLGSLREGKTIRVPLADSNELSLVPSVSSADAIAADVRALRPSVGAELLAIIHGPGIALDSPAGMLALYNSMHAVSTMKGTTYFSVTRGKEQVLFLDSFAVASRSDTTRIPDPVFTQIPPENDIFTLQEDNSFGKNVYGGHLSARADHFLLKTENDTAITFLLIPIISPHGMVSQVVVIPSGTDVLFYGTAYLRSNVPLGDKASRTQSMENRLAALAGWLSRRIAAIGNG